MLERLRSGWRHSMLDERQRGRLLLSQASAFSFAVPFLFSPLWSRVYPVEYFAMAALVQTLPGLFAGWSTGAFHNALHTPREERSAVLLAIAALLAVGVCGTILGGVCWFHGGRIAKLLGGSAELKRWLWMAPALLVLTGSGLVMDQWMARRRMFEPMARAIAYQAVLGPLVPALGSGQPDRTNFILLGLIVGNTGGLLLRVHYSGLAGEIFRAKPSWRALAGVIRGHLNFPRDVLPGSVLTAIAAQLPQVMIARHFSTDTLGHFARASTLLMLPSVVFANSFATVFNQEAGMAYREKGDCRAEFKRTLRQLLWIMIPVYGFLGAVSPWLYPWFYGASWQESGLLARPLSLYYMVTTVCGPLSAVLYFGGNTKWDLLWQTARLPVVFIALWWGCLTGKVGAAVLAYAAANVLVYAAYLGLSYRFTIKNPGPSSSPVPPAAPPHG